jgi:predicted MFS family arabinose efflux permease
MSLLAALGALIVTGAPTAAVAAIGVFLARGLAWSVLPVVSAVWINRATASETRATVQSFLGQATAAGQILGGLLLGAVSAAAGLTAAIALATALFAASGIVILRGGAAPGRPTST